LNGAALRVAEFLGVGVSPGRQRLKPSKLARFTLEHEEAGSRDLKRQKRAGVCEVDEIEPACLKPRRQRDVKRIEIGGAVAHHTDVDVAVCARAAERNRPEQDNQSHLGDLFADVGQSIASRVGCDRSPHAVTLSTAIGPVNVEPQGAHFFAGASQRSSSKKLKMNVT
jgi:hypothetical protein